MTYANLYHSQVVLMSSKVYHIAQSNLAVATYEKQQLHTTHLRAFLSISVEKSLISAKVRDITAG